MTRIAHVFVDQIPDVLEPSTLYVSIEYKTAIHLCFCGCGNEVVTPISPAGWRLTFDGDVVSLHPSIGSWSLACQSHYWITSSRIIWAAKFSKVEVSEVRRSDESALRALYPEPRNRGIWRILRRK